MMQNRTLCFICIFLIFLSGCLTEQKEKVYVKDLVIGELKRDEHAISFFVVNENDKTGDCMAKILINNNQSSTHDIGLINSGKDKFFETNIKLDTGETSIKILPNCEWVTEKEATECNYQNWSERKLCMLTLDKPNLKQCLEGDVIYYKFFCIALISKNPETCEYIRSSTKRSWCKAYVTGNISFCENIQTKEDKDWCYTDIGMNFKDLSICDKISDEKSKKSCRATKLQDPELCLNGAEAYKTSCIRDIVESTGKKELCGLLSSEQKEECLEQ